mgnify:CR=1 FL=1
MPLIKSISGIRGTIGGYVEENLTPIDIVRFISRFAYYLREENKDKSNIRIVIGRDARLSGLMIRNLVVGTLVSLGCEVIDIGLAATPTVELAVINENADGGLIITASHNPIEWNALKPLNKNGEFIDKAILDKVLSINEKNINYSSVSNLGKIIYKDYTTYHVNKILTLPYIDTKKIKEKNLKIVLDVVNSIGSKILPPLLAKLGVRETIVINWEMNGTFAHNPEPVSQNIKDIQKKVVEYKADLGIVVDPDVDRVCFICENGESFDEEYTIVAVCDYILPFFPENKRITVSNLSTTNALKIITLKHNGKHYMSAVGELNVIKKMKEVNAIIGGEGNGGVILPELHYGRDAVLAIALFLSYLANLNITPSQLKSKLPKLYLIKDKVELNKDLNIHKLINMLLLNFSNFISYNLEDGLRLDFDNGWIHVRISNTEKIIRIYSEADSLEIAKNLNEKAKTLIMNEL